MRTLSPATDHLTLAAVPLSTLNPGALHLVSDVQPPDKGTVCLLLEKGPRVSLDAKPGSFVIVDKHKGTQISVDGTTYLIARERDIIATLGS